MTDEFDGSDGTDASGQTGGTGESAASPPSKGWAPAPDEETYQDLWTCYRDGERRKQQLTRRCKTSHEVVYTAIHRGWPELEWPALEQRLELWERQKAVARRKALEDDRVAAEREATTEAQQWRAFQRNHSEIVHQAQQFVAGFGKKLETALKAATFVRYRNVPELGAEGQPLRDKRGRIRMVPQAYIDGVAVMKAGALWAQAVKELPHVQRFLLGPAAMAPEPTAPDFTPQQLEQMARGEIPEGVTPADIGRALLAATTGNGRAG